MKVLFINNYPMDRQWKLWHENQTGGHHLWGVTNFQQYGLQPHIIAHEKYSILKKISAKIKLLGDLDQQLRILQQQNKFDVVYTGHYRNTLLLAFLRKIGLFKKPILAIACQSLPLSSWTALFFDYFVKGHDKLICMNPRIRNQFQHDFHIPPEKLESSEWGIDLAYVDSKVSNNQEDITTTNPPLIVSAGKTYRDYDTLTQALSNTDYQLKIYCTKDAAPQSVPIADNIQIIYDEQKMFAISDEYLFQEYKKAYAVAIPLDVNEHNSYNMIGITSLLDAMAMGKASVMTRNPQINIDIEQEGIGIWVDSGDTEGWHRAISYLMEHPEETKAMGEKARYLCETKYNLDVFADSIGAIFKRSLNY